MEIKTKKERGIKRAYIWLFTSIILSLILYFINVPIDLKFPLYMFLIVIGYGAGILKFLEPINPVQKAFLQITKAIEIIENPYASSENRMIAYNSIIKAP